MKKYEKDTLIEVNCNGCGKKIAVKHGISKEEMFHVEKRWGYFSKKDMQQERFDLCEECYEKIIEGFVIPVEKKEETEFFPC